MKKLYTFFLAMLVAVTAAHASVSFTLKVNLPDQVKVQVDYNDVALTGETTVLSSNSDYPSVSISLSNSAEYTITSAVNKAGTSVGYSYPASNTYFNPEDGDEYTVTVTKKDDLRTASFTLKVDDASKIQMRYGTGDPITGFEGGNVANTIKFNPNDRESSIGIMSANSGESIYKVTLDGNKVEGSYGSYTVNVTDGCLVEVQSVFPDEPCTVTFEYGEGAEGFFSEITINDSPATVTDGVINARLGDKLGLVGNTNTYTFEALYINGEKQSMQYGFTFSPMTLTEDLTIKVEAHQKTKVSFILNIDNPDNIKVYNAQYTYGATPIQGLKAGDNPISVPEDNTYISLEAQPTCKLQSIMDGDGNTLTTTFTVSKDMKVYVTSSRMERNINAVLWVDDPKAGRYFGGSFNSSDRLELTGIVAGYNQFSTAEELNPLNISWYIESPAEGAQQLYVNGVKQSPKYSDPNNYDVNVVAGDVIKAFLTGAPVDATVHFTADGNVEGVKVTRDIITDVPAWDDLTDNVFAGTQYSLTGDNIAVKVNGAAITAGADGAYTFVAGEGATEVNVSATDGIAGIEADGTADAEVYNLQGIRVGTRQQMENLPAGIYICAGRKFIVR